MATPLLFSAFVMNTASHILHGVWRQPDGHQINFNSLDLWVDLAKELEAGLFDAIFFADVTGLYSKYKGSHRKHIEMGLQIPSNDPSVILSALAYNTEHLGLALTSNIMQEHPFNFARKMSTLDHASNGRIAWNIVTNPLTNAAHNFGQDLTPHDERYEWASEYVDVAYKLWEGSWDDGALLQDRKSGISGDYDKIHRINHVGERYSVEGPHLVSPSPQRTPLLFQAGSSEAGMNFAAANAEAQFLVVPRPEIAASVIETTRNLLPKYGRSREDIKFFQGLSFMVGSTEAEAARKSNELDEAIDLPAMMAHLGGGIEELDAYDLDQPLADIKTEGIRSILDWVQASVKGRKATVRDFAIRSGRSGRVTGTPEQIADRLEIWQAAGIDGINVINATIPGSYTEFITHVMPELQKRGLAKREYTPGTLRHKLFGRDTLSDTHPAAAYRGAFR
ncbi:MAG: LLM class flavin-dependent oxidoreductase [Gammaproteobacteria bacterium]|nr:MAG: LLM class flavin-dependent oxidoreductase [Gammaproteobacteria bacterium]